MTIIPVVNGVAQGPIPFGARTIIRGDICEVYLDGESLPPPSPPTLEELRAPLKAANLQKRIDFEQAGIAYTFADGDGVAQTRDARDLVNINGITTNAMIAQAAGVTEAILTFRDQANVTHVMTPEQAIAFGVAIGQGIAGAYQTKWSIDAQIDALTTEAAIAAFDVDAAWSS